MRLHKHIEMPEDVYPIDDWQLIQSRFDPANVAQAETIFALANGYLGMRGAFEEGRPAADDGTLVNGFFEFRPIVYPEEAYGFPREGQTILYVPEGKIVRLYVDDEPVDLCSAQILSYRRTLDMRAGLLRRDVEYATALGKRVRVRSARMVSLRRRHLAAIDYEVMLLDRDAEVSIRSELVYRSEQAEGQNADPRKAPLFAHRVLTAERIGADGTRSVQCFRTQLSNLWIACGIEHRLETDCAARNSANLQDDGASVDFLIDAEAGKPIRLSKFAAYHTAENGLAEELCSRAETTLARAKHLGFERLAEEQRDSMERFWRDSDVAVGGIHPRSQQVIRWNLFQLLQASARVEGFSIPARGLTGRVYEGHYFWDTEMYQLPFLIYTAPEVAKRILEHRYLKLDRARNRARELSHAGAAFPWRTINGDEASTFFLASTAQYHINACIMYALKKYVDVTSDEDFLFEAGAEMYVETARLWLSLGCRPASDPDHFHINGVTGPDEYTALVNNNFFTNAMARDNLWNAVAVLRRMEQERPDACAALAERVGLDDSEPVAWREAADQMCLPYDERLGIHLQDDSFTLKERWDLASMPERKFPLLLHYHYLEIYRHQVIKQADTILAMFLLGHQFSAEEKKRNFYYYDPLTTGDSSLSACIQSIVAAEIGEMDMALEYLRSAAVMDLGDVAGNVVDGAHLASIGGTWMALVYGFGGLRDYDGRISFSPRLPVAWTFLRFALTIRGQILDVDMRQGKTTYLLREGAGLTIAHQGRDVALTTGNAVTLAC